MDPNRPHHRTQTRAERYQEKSKTAKVLPVSIATTNFNCDGNVAYLMRALACFGGETIHIIGKIPPSNELKRLSGGHNELVKIVHHTRPEDFIAWARSNGSYVIAAELAEGAINIHEAYIPLDKPVIFVVGSEMEGIPTEISLTAHKTVYVPMPGRGFCLNTSQTGNILLYEFAKRFLEET